MATDANTHNWIFYGTVLTAVFGFVGWCLLGMCLVIWRRWFLAVPAFGVGVAIVYVMYKVFVRAIDLYYSHLNSYR